MVFQKLTAILRMMNILAEYKRKLLIETFFECQFNYFLLIWINRLHQRALRIAYDDYCSSFEELLNKDGSVTIHQRNLRALAIEIYKISNGLSPTFLVEMMNE